MRYAHQGGMNPPRVIIHGNALHHVSDSYKRYLEGFFRDEFELRGTPLRIEFRTGRNPFAGRGHKDGMNRRTGKRVVKKAGKR
jgi:GTP-binding protein